MPAAIDTLPNLDQLNADIQDLVHKLNVLGDQVLEKCDLIVKAIQRVRATIDADLRKGVEAKQFARSLTHLQKYGSDVIQFYAVVKGWFAGWKKGTEALAPLLKDAEAFVAWLDDLLARFNRPTPPIDEEMLRERARQCEEANAWVNFDDALAELKKSDS